jgi:hypothetical protein
VTLAAACLSGTRAAGQAAEPYSRIGIRVSGVQPVSIGAFRSLYSSSRGVSAAVEVPAEFGSLGVAMSRQTFSRLADGPAPEMKATTHAIEWRSPAAVARRLSASAGVTVADFDMAFADTVIVEGLRDERELMVGATGRFAIEITRHWSISADAMVARIMLHQPVTMTTLSAGLAWSARPPAWLQRFLR